MKLTKKFVLTIVVGLFILPFLGFANSGPNKLSTEQVQTHRSWLMKAMAGHYIAICGPSIAGECGEGHYPEDRQFHAKSIAGLAGIMEKTFPEGSGEGSYALPIVWEEPAKFRNELKKHQLAADNLVKTAAEKDSKAYRDAIQGLYRTCRSCHSVFRDEKIYENYK
ncbi:cytochrome c [Porticoccaceae bacterium]|nr:cytochrome c [Porticoccaceae bacterium]